MQGKELCQRVIFAAFVLFCQPKSSSSPRLILTGMARLAHRFDIPNTIKICKIKLLRETTRTARKVKVNPFAWQKKTYISQPSGGKPLHIQKRKGKGMRLSVLFFCLCLCMMVTCFIFSSSTRLDTLLQHMSYFLEVLPCLQLGFGWLIPTTTISATHALLDSSTVLSIGLFLLRFLPRRRLCSVHVSVFFVVIFAAVFLPVVETPVSTRHSSSNLFDNTFASKTCRDFPRRCSFRFRQNPNPIHVTFRKISHPCACWILRFIAWRCTSFHTSRPPKTKTVMEIALGMIWVCTMARANLYAQNVASKNCLILFRAAGIRRWFKVEVTIINRASPIIPQIHCFSKVAGQSTNRFLQRRLLASGMWFARNWQPSVDAVNGWGFVHKMAKIEGRRCCKATTVSCVR